MNTHLPIDIDLSEDITEITVINYRGDTVADVKHPPTPEDTGQFKCLDFITNIRGVFHS